MNIFNSDYETKILLIDIIKQRICVMKDKRNLSSSFNWGENKWGNLDPVTNQWNGMVSKVKKMRHISTSKRRIG